MVSNERTALIIGTSRGLGLRLVRQHRERGWSVVATLRDESAVPEAFRGDARIEIARLDVANQAEIAALAVSFFRTVKIRYNIVDRQSLYAHFPLQTKTWVIR